MVHTQNILVPEVITLEVVFPEGKLTKANYRSVGTIKLLFKQIQ